MPFSKSAGNHQTYIVDITTLMVVGKYQFKTVFPSCRRLTMNIDQSIARYVETVKKEMDIHQLPECLTVFTAATDKYPASEETIKGRGCTELRASK